MQTGASVPPVPGATSLEMPDDTHRSSTRDTKPTSLVSKAGSGLHTA